MPRLKKIMVIDDEAAIRNLLFDVLTRQGFEVTLAVDGLDSLRHLRNRRFDLLITDINMPRLDGIGLLRRMKSEGRREKIIVMTAEPFDQSSLGDAIPTLFDQLEKPFNIKHFLNTVSSALYQFKRDCESEERMKIPKRAVNAI